MTNNTFWNEKGKNCLQKLLEKSESFEAFQKIDCKIENIDAFLDHARDFLQTTLAEETYARVLEDHSNGTYTLQNIKDLAINFFQVFEPFSAKVQGVTIEEGSGIGTCFKRFFKKTLPALKFDTRPLETQFYTGSTDKVTNKKVTTADHKHPEINKGIFPFFYELKTIYDLRNFLDHSKDEGYITKIRYADEKFLDTEDYEQHAKLQKTCLLAYLALIAYAYPEVKEYLGRNNEPNFNYYLNQIIKKHEEYVQKYIVNKDPENIIDLKLQHNNKNIYDTLNAETRFMISGTAGVGKTTSLKQTAYLLATEIKDIQNDEGNNTKKAQKKPIPVFMELGEKEMNLIEETAKMLDIETNKVQSLINRNRLVFMLDALNETTELHLINTKNELKKLAKDHPQLKIILSGRPNEHHDMKQDFKSFQFKDIEPTTLKQFLERNASTAIQKEKLHNALQNNNNIVNILQKSCFLIAQYTEKLIKISHSNEELPKNKNEIIELYVNEIILREMKKKSENQFITDNRPIFILLLCLFANIDGSENYMDYLTIVKNITANLKETEYPSVDMKTIIETIKLATQMGFLEKNALLEDKYQYKFANPDFKSYFEQHSV